MVKKATTAKTKKEMTVEEKIDGLDSETTKKESAPQVMQVVEVMDEEIITVEPSRAVTQSDEDKEKFEENPEIEVTHNGMVEPKPAEQDVPETPKTESEKKQEVVSEFFTKKEQPSTFGYPDISVHKKSAMPGVILWALGVIILVVAIGATIIGVSRGTVKMPSLAAKPTPTPTVAPLPTATPTPVVDRKTVKIEVLNGSGIAGQANKMKALLEEKGYTVAGTGNAKSYDYAKTEIQVTADNEKFISVITADLSGTYSVGSSAATLKSTLPYNAVVIVGKE